MANLGSLESESGILRGSRTNGSGQNVTNEMVRIES